LQILRRIKEEMRSKNPVIEVITTASMIPEEVGDNYIKAFNKLNCSRVNLMHIRDRVDVKEQE